jgi:hypothetical protein
MKERSVTLRDIVAGYKLVNEWQSEQEKQRLPLLTVQDSLRQYFELSQLTHQLAPDLAQVFQEERIAYWTEWHEKLCLAARVMIHATIS